MAEVKSSHILNTSSTMLGFCLIILTSLKATKYSSLTLIDELTGVASILFTFSSIFSILSMRTENPEKGRRLEKAADLIFLIALLLISATILLISFDVIV